MRAWNMRQSRGIPKVTEWMNLKRLCGAGLPRKEQGAGSQDLKEDGPENSTTCRRTVSRLNHLAQDRPDTASAWKEASRITASPEFQDWSSIERVAEYLAGCIIVIHRHRTQRFRLGRVHSHKAKHGRYLSGSVVKKPANNSIFHHGSRTYRMWKRQSGKLRNWIKSEGFCPICAENFEIRSKSGLGNGSLNRDGKEKDGGERRNRRCEDHRTRKKNRQIIYRTAGTLKKKKVDLQMSRATRLKKYRVRLDILTRWKRIKKNSCKSEQFGYSYALKICLIEFFIIWIVWIIFGASVNYLRSIGVF